MAAAKKSTSMTLVYEKILQKIMKEQLLPGTPLREDKIAEEFGVSPTPVREAFRRLEYEGWLQSFPYRGCYLRKFSREEIYNHYELREMLEGLAAAATARNATAEELESLRTILAEEQRYIDENCRCGTVMILPSFQPDIDFHHTITAICHNRLLQQRLEMLNAQIASTFLLCRAKRTSIVDIIRVHREHEMILGAIERHWDQAAETLMRLHIRDARPLFLSIWDEKKSGN